MEAWGIKVEIWLKISYNVYMLKTIEASAPVNFSETRREHIRYLALCGVQRFYSEIAEGPLSFDEGWAKFDQKYNPYQEHTSQQLQERSARRVDRYRNLGFPFHLTGKRRGELACKWEYTDPPPLLYAPKPSYPYKDMDAEIKWAEGSYNNIIIRLCLRTERGVSMLEFIGQREPEIEDIPKVLSFQRKTP